MSEETVYIKVVLPFALNTKRPRPESGRDCLIVLQIFFFFFFTLVTGPRRSLSLKLSDTRVYEPQVRCKLLCSVSRM